jgi:membrane fusion protein (multidrug efflux system)
MPVEVAEARVTKVADTFSAVGTLEASESISVVSELDAVVVRIPFREGEVIRRGELIAQLDDSQLAAEVARAEAVLAQGKVSYDRVKSIVELRAAAPQDLDDAVAALHVAEAELALARARFEKTRIVAPFDGLIGARKVSEGTFLRSGQAITDLANIDDLRVIFSAPERFIPQLRRGGEVIVSTTVYPDLEVTGKIIAVEPLLDPATRNARIVAELPNPEQKFRPGMSADISAVLAERMEAVTIPNEAVFASGTQSFVYRVNPDSTATRVAITLGTRLPDVVEVVEGLEPGAQVVRAGHQKIFEGAKVMPVTSQGATREPSEWGGTGEPSEQAEKGEPSQ